LNRRRVVVTGLGVVAPNGIGRESFGTALVLGESGIAEFSTPGDSHPGCRVAGRVTGFDLSTHLNSRSFNSCKSMSRVSEFAVGCAQMALNDAGIDFTRLNPHRTGICHGTTTGKPDFADDVGKFFESGAAGLDATAWEEFSPYAPASHIAQELGLLGPVTACSAGCCTGLMAVEWGADQIAQGRLDIALAGGADSLLSPLIVAACSAGNLLTKQSDPAKASRPYDLYRDGLVPSEAAGVIVLETLESAVQRNARIYAECLGWGCAVDGANISDRNHNGQGLCVAIQRALENAEINPDQIDCINAHGLSHPVFDLIETRGFKAALGSAVYRLPVTSIKSMTGVSFAGDGMLQIISSCLILEKGVIPPILNLDTPDPACDLDYVVKTARQARVERILTNTRAIGGTNMVLILGRVDTRA
jgi:3-oxoacyl-[acyl-carrier-protein] synthase II